MRRTLLLLLCMFTLGCQSANPITQWQRHVEQYIDTEGGGNFAVVRNVGNDPTHVQLGMFGERRGAIKPKRTDINSVVVGHRRINNRYWLIFIVGEIRQDGGVVDVQFDQPMVESLRAAAVSRDGDDYLWVVSDENDAALRAYIAAQEAHWRQSHPERANQPVPWTRFPTDHDRYQLTINGPHITITETRSNATWTLTLPTPD